MSRTLAADFLAAMESGIFTPYFNLQLMDVDRATVMFETEDVTGFELDGLKAIVSFHDPGYEHDFYMFRIQRGVVISGTPHYVTSSCFWPTIDRHEKRIRTLEGHIFPAAYYSTDGDHTYHEVIDDVCAHFGLGVTFEDPAAAWLSYQFLPAGKLLNLNNARYFFSFLRQKYLIFATDYDDDNLFFYQAKNTAPAYPAGYTTITARSIAAPGVGALKSKYLISLDESGVAHNSGTSTNPIHHLGYLHSTASHPDRTWFIDTTDWVVQGIPPNLKYLDFDPIIIEYDVVDQTVWPAKFREIFNRKLTPTWQWQMRNLDIYGDTEGGALPANIQTAAPYMPLNTSGFNGILDENDTNLQEAMNTIDGHTHPGAGMGDVVGPAGATADHLAVFDGATGKLIKDGGAAGAAVKLDDAAAPDDNTDLNASTTKHGLLLKATAPAAGLLNVVGIANGETAYANKALFDATHPADLGTSAEGSQVIAARRDHVHTLPKLDDMAAVDDNTDLNASTTAHGLAVKPVAPASPLMNVMGIVNGETAWSNKALFDATHPADIGTAAEGSAATAARRDHVHALTTLPASTIVPDGGTIGQAAGPLLTFDDTNNYLEISGCDVGVGTDAPEYPLDILSPTAADAVRMRTSSALGSGSGGSNIVGTSLQPTAAGHRIGTFIFQGFDGTVNRNGVALAAYAAAAWSSNVMPTYFIFRTAPLAGGAVLTRMYISSEGNIGINTITPNTDAILDVASTTKAFMPPRMTTTQRDAIGTPVAGMVIYNTTTNVLNFHNGSAWAAV